jgi:hypothetical protein
MSIARVQHTSINQSSSVASQALAYVSNVTLNDLLIVIARCGSIVSTTVTDTQGNTWHNLTYQSISAFGSLQISWAIANATGANTVTVTPDASSTIRMAILEYSGNPTSSPVDAENNTQTGTSTAAAATSITPAAANELVIGAVVVNGSDTFTAGANFALVEQVPAAPSTKLGVEEWIQTTATATTAPQTFGASNQWMAAIAVFKAAAAGAFAPEDDSFPVPRPAAVEQVVSVW